VAIERDLQAPPHADVDGSTILWAQIRKANPHMGIDGEGLLRPKIHPNAKGKLYLGDVGDAVIRSLGAVDPPEVTEAPSYDEQKWRIDAKKGDLLLSIISRSYWGFGMFSSCILLRIELKGPRSERFRLVYDVWTALKRNPWEPVFRFMWVRATGASLAAHQDAWMKTIDLAKEDMKEDIAIAAEAVGTAQDKFDKNDDDIEGYNREEAELALKNSSREIEIAHAALLDRNAPAVERALGRVEGLLHFVDPVKQVALHAFDEEEGESYPLDGLLDQMDVNSMPLFLHQPLDFESHAHNDDLVVIDLTQQE